MAIRTQMLLMVISLLVAGVLATATVLAWSSRQALLAETEAEGVVIARLLARSAEFGASVRSDVEDAIGEQMIVEATIVAHLVAIAEGAGLTPREINARLRAIVEETVLDEFWVTDEKGRAYLRNKVEVDFAFSPDPREQPQAHVFWPLLTGERRIVVQEARQREVDTEVFKYVGVAGIDRPRIVQVGYHAKFLEQLGQRVGLTRLVDDLVRGGNLTAIRVVDRDMATLAFSALPGLRELQDLSRTDVARLRAVASEGRTLSAVDGPTLKVMAPIESGELAGGAIVVHVPTDRVQAAILSQAWMATAVAAFVLLGGLLVAIVVAKSFSNPIMSLTETTKRIAGGDLMERVNISARNEIGELAASFNDMTARLQGAMDELRETTAAKERIESELNIAREIQMSMLPKIFPPFPDRHEFDLYAIIIPAREVGGDFYDFFFIDDHHLCITVGDVSGKGVPASLFMAVTKALFRATAGKIASPAGILSQLNGEICRDNDSCTFVTMFCAVVDIRTGQIEYSNGGHNLPFVLGGGGVQPLENTEGMALGIVEGARFGARTIVLRPGDGLLLYTDGITEATDRQGQPFSEQRLQRVLEAPNGGSAETVVRGVIEEVRKFSGGAPQADDITALLIEYFGERRAGGRQGIYST